MDFMTESFDIFLQQCIKTTAVFVVEKDVLPIIATQRNVINSTRKMES